MSVRAYRDIHRRKSRQIRVGNVLVGGDAPITVQTMTNTLTADAKATIEQIQRCEAAGVDIIRVSCPDVESTAALRQIVDRLPVNRHDRAIDVPCGDGFYSRLLSRRCREVVGADLSNEFLARARRQSEPPAIAAVADQRVTPVCEVHAYLVCPPGLQLDTYISVRRKSFDHAVVRRCRLATIAYGHSLAVHRMTPDRLVDCTAAC